MNYIYFIIKNKFTTIFDLKLLSKMLKKLERNSLNTIITNEGVVVQLRISDGKVNKKNLEQVEEDFKTKVMENFSEVEFIEKKTWDSYFCILDKEKISEWSKQNKKSKEKKKLINYRINHIETEGQFYRMIKLKNVKNFNFEEILDKGYINFTAVNKENKIEELKSEIVKKKGKLEEEYITTDIIEADKYINTFDLGSEFDSFEFDITIFLQANSLQELDKKTIDVRLSLAESSVYTNVLTHNHSPLVLHKLSLGGQYSFTAFLGKNNYILNYTNLISKQSNSSQSLFDFEIMKNGIMKNANNEYFELLELKDINYRHSKEEDKYNIFTNYCSLLNSISDDISMQILIDNDVLDYKKVCSEILAGSELDIVDEYNGYLQDNIEISKRDSTIRTLYLVIKTENDSPKLASEIIQRNIIHLQRSVKDLGSKLNELSFEKKVITLHNMLNFDYSEIYENRLFDFDFSKTKVSDIVSPSSLKFKFTDIQQGLTFAKSVCINAEKYPTQIKDTFISDLAKLPIKSQISIHVGFEDKAKTIDILQRKVFSMERLILNKKEKANGKGYISYELKDTYQNALTVRDEIEKKDKKFFSYGIYITVFAKTQEQLTKHLELLNSTIKKNMFKIRALPLRQQQGYLTTLPIGIDLIKERRNILTDNAAILTPFSSQWLYHSKGIYYGLSDENQLIVVDRINYKNPSGWFLGVPGSGKSFLAKKEMLSVILRHPDHDVIIIDPENEYGKLIQHCGGEVIKISGSSANYINPLDITDDLNLLKEVEDNPITIKQEFILTFLEILAMGLDLVEKSIVDEILGNIYKGYIEKLEEYSKQTAIYEAELKKNPKAEMKKPEKPRKANFKDFYNILKDHEKYEAKHLASRISIYVTGSLSVFSNDTNVKLDDRLLCFNIKDLGDQLKTAGLLLVCDMLWNRVCINKLKGKRTWVYIDEIYLLFENEESAKFLFEFYKRVRKYHGVPTGITQNVEDLLKSQRARTMLSNAEFKVILDQSPTDREQLGDLFDLSDSQLNVIKNSQAGTGLIIAGKDILHFTDKMKDNTEMFKIMTTRLEN